MERPVETLGQRVKKVRVEREMSQAKLAELSGLRQPDISKIELGLIEKTTGIARLASALNVTPHWLETGEGSREAMLIDGQHRWYADLKDLDPQKVLLEALNVDAMIESERLIEHRAQTEEEQRLLTAFRCLPNAEREALIRDVTSRAALLNDMLARYLAERGETSGPAPAPGPGHGPRGMSVFGELDELPPAAPAKKTSGGTR